VPKLTKPILAVLALSEWRVFRFLLFLFTPDEADEVDGGEVVEGPGLVTCVRFVECVGLGGGFISVVSRWKTKKMICFMPPLGNFHGGWRK
jgi:hypothetical protein